MEYRTNSPEKAIKFAQAAVRACIPFSYCDVGKTYEFSLDCSEESFKKIFAEFLPKAIESYRPTTASLLRPLFKECHISLLMDHPKAATLWAKIITNSISRGMQLTNILGFYPGDYVNDFIWNADEELFIRLMEQEHATREGKYAMAPAPDPTPIVDKM